MGARQSAQCAPSSKRRRKIICRGNMNQFLGVIGTQRCPTDRKCCSYYKCMFQDCKCNAMRNFLPMVIPLLNQLGVQHMLDSAQVAKDTKLNAVRIRLCEQHMNAFIKAMINNALAIWGEKMVFKLFDWITKAAILVGDSSVDTETLNLLFSQIGRDRDIAKELQGGYKKKRRHA